MGLGKSKPAGRSGPVPQNNKNVRAEISFNTATRNYPFHFAFKKNGTPNDYRSSLATMLHVMLQEGVITDSEEKNKIILIEINDAQIASELYDLMLIVVDDSGYVGAKFPDNITLKAIYKDESIFPSAEKQQELGAKLAAIKNNRNVKGKLNNFQIAQMIKG